MKKRGDANIWWIIIGAVIALVVLIVMMLIFTGKTQPLQQGLSNCEGKGGICVPSNDGCPRNTLSASAFDCDSGGKCCIGTAKKCTSGSTTDCGTEGICNPNNYCYPKTT